MVANLTVGRKGYEAAWEGAAALAERAQRIKDRLLMAVDEDTAAFNAVMDARRLPAGNPEQDSLRRAAIERATQRAATVPLETARLCADAAALAAEIAGTGNRASGSDAGVAALTAQAGAAGAALNVLINLEGIEDVHFKRTAEQGAAEAVTRAQQLAARAMALVQDGLPVRATWIDDAARAHAPAASGASKPHN
jgi:glutamate formiminotransferase/formiminotetrahydrofolate cyclodeaminase